MAAITTKAISDCFLGLSLLIEPTLFFIRHPRCVFGTRVAVHSHSCVSDRTQSCRSP